MKQSMEESTSRVRADTVEGTFENGVMEAKGNPKWKSVMSREKGEGVEQKKREKGWKFTCGRLRTA